MGWLAQLWCHRARPVHLAAFEGVPLVLNFLLFHICPLRCIYSNPQKAWLKNIGVDKIPQKSWSILRSTCYKWRGSFSPTRKKLRISIFLRGCERPTGWWFGTCFISPIVGMMIQSDFHHLSSVSGGRYTTNQQKWTDLEPGPWFFRPRKGAPRALGGARKKPPVGAAGVENQGR